VLRPPSAPALHRSLAAALLRAGGAAVRFIHFCFDPTCPRPLQGQAQKNQLGHPLPRIVNRALMAASVRGAPRAAITKLSNFPSPTELWLPQRGSQLGQPWQPQGGRLKTPPVETVCHAALPAGGPPAGPRPAADAGKLGCKHAHLASTFLKLQLPGSAACDCPAPFFGHWSAAPSLILLPIASPPPCSARAGGCWRPLRPTGA